MTPRPASWASDLCSYTRHYVQKGLLLDLMLADTILKFLITFLTGASHFHFALGLLNYVASLVQGKPFSSAGETKFSKHHSMPGILFKANRPKVNINQSNNVIAEYIT